MMNPSHNPIDELADIYEFWHKPWWQTKIFYLSLLGLAAVLLLGVLWYVIRAVRSRKKITPWQRALTDFQQLKTSSYASEQEISAAYFAMRTTLKRYLAVRYSEDFFDKTDEELIKMLPNFIDQAAVVTDIKDLLTQSTHAVFAAMAASRQSFDDSIEKAISVVKRTIPQPIKK